MTRPLTSGVGRHLQGEHDDVAQAAEILNQSVKTVTRRISDGTLPAYRIGPRLIRVRVEDLDESCRRIPSARP